MVPSPPGRCWATPRLYMRSVSGRRAAVKGFTWPSRHLALKPALLHWLWRRGISETPVMRSHRYPSPPGAALSLGRVPVPARGHHPGGPVVLAVRPLLPGLGTPDSGGTALRRTNVAESSEGGSRSTDQLIPDPIV